MSALKLVQLAFHMSYNDLVACCTEKEAYLNRDVAELEARGITPDIIAALKKKKNDFVVISPNVVMRAKSTIGFEKRNLQTEVLRKGIHVVYDIAKDTFLQNSAELKLFNATGLSKMDADELLKICPNIIEQSTLFITKMTVKGLLPTMLTNITTQAAALMPLNSATPTLVGNAESATVVRRNAANDLYSTLEGLCRTGHTFYIAAEDGVKAENYVIYNGSSKIVDRSGIVKPQKRTSRKTDKIIATTPVRMKVTIGTGLVFYYGMTKTSLPTVHAVTVPYNPNIFIKKTAEELGYDLAGGIIHLIIYNPNGDDAKFLAKIG